MFAPPVRAGGGTLWVLGWGVPHRRVIKNSLQLGVPRLDCEVSGFDLDQLGPTLFCIE